MIQKKLSLKKVVRNWEDKGGEIELIMAINLKIMWKQHHTIMSQI